MKLFLFLFLLSIHLLTVTHAFGQELIDQYNPNVCTSSPCDVLAADQVQIEHGQHSDVVRWAIADNSQRELGMSLNTKTGLFTWTPTNNQAGNFTIQVVGLDVNGTEIVSSDISITVETNDQIDWTNVLFVVPAEYAPNRNRDMTGAQEFPYSYDAFGSLFCKDDNGDPITTSKTVFFRGGLHTTDIGDNPAAIFCSGESLERPFTLSAWGNERPVLSPKGTEAIKIQGDFVTLSGFEIAGYIEQINLAQAVADWWWEERPATPEGYIITAQGILAKGRGIVIQNNLVHSWPGNAVKIEGDLSSMLDNVVFNSGYYSTRGVGGVMVEGLNDSELAMPADRDFGIIIKNNVVFGNESRIISHVFSKDFSTLEIDEGSALNLQQNGGDYTRGYLVENNAFLYNGKGVGLRAKNIVFRNNTVYGNGLNIRAPGASGVRATKITTGSLASVFNGDAGSIATVNNNIIAVPPNQEAISIDKVSRISGGCSNNLIQGIVDDDNQDCGLSENVVMINDPVLDASNINFSPLLGSAGAKQSLITDTIAKLASYGHELKPSGFNIMSIHDYDEYVLPMINEILRTTPEGDVGVELTFEDANGSVVTTVNLDDNNYEDLLDVATIKFNWLGTKPKYDSKNRFAGSYEQYIKAAPDPYYSVIATVSPVGSGYVTCSDISIRSTKNQRQVSCEAVPLDGYTFTSWSGDCSGDTCDIASVNGDVSLIAVFDSKLSETDTDNDGIPDIRDDDDDNDDVVDDVDVYPLISIGDLTDTDSDGAPDECDDSCLALGMSADSDDDNDGLIDSADAYPLKAIDLSKYEETYTFSAGQYQTCFVSDLESICWGSNPYIDLSQYIDQFDDILSISSGSNEICVTTNKGLFCNSNKIIDASENPSQTSVGGPHSCSIVNSGIKCWGSNGYGQLFIPENISNPTHVSVGWQHVCAIDDSGIICWGNRDKNLLDIPENITNPTDLSAGYYHTCAVGDEVVHCWGSDGFGRTNVPSGLSKPFAVASGSRHSCALDENGVKCWGDNTYNQLEIPDNISNPIAISAGYLHTCILDDNGIKCWGDDTFGQSSVPLLNIDPDQDGFTNQRGIDQFPFNFLEWKDTDGDNIGDYLDYDSDNDGFFDSQVIKIDNILRNEDNSSMNVTFLANGIIFTANYLLDSQNEWRVTYNELDSLSYEINQLFIETAFEVVSAIKAYNIVSYDEFELFFSDVKNIKTSFPLNQPFQDMFPYDSTEWNDNDTDGIGDNSDLDDDNDSLLDNAELALGTNPKMSDTDGDGINDNEDNSTIIISSAFPSLKVSVISPFEDIERASFRLTSLANPNMVVIYPSSITGNKVTFEYEFHPNVVSSEYRISTVSLIRENGDVVQDDQDYYFDLVNENDSASEFSIQDPNVIYNKELGIVNVKFIVDGLVGGISRIWPVGNDNRLNMNITFVDENDLSIQASVLKREVLAGLNGTNVLNFEYSISREFLPETIYVQSIALTDKALNGARYNADTDNDNIIDVLDAYPLTPITGYVDVNKNGAPEQCDESCIALGMSLEDVSEPKYYLLEQSSFDFASLTPTAKVIVTGSDGENFFDIARYVDAVSMVGQTFLVSGSSSIDGFRVMPGVKYDLTNLKGSVDTLYFSGPLSEYAGSILLDSSTGVMQLSRLTDIGEEVVQFIASNTAADVLVFSDGAISTSEVKTAVLNNTDLTTLTLDTSVSAMDDKVTTGAQVKHIILDNDGAGAMALGPNIQTLISGSSGVDQIYVPEGSVVDASNLKSGQDEVYVQGDLADYDKAFDTSGNIILTREVTIDTETYTESIAVASGGNVATNDLVIFADQQLQTQVLKQQYLN